MRLTECKKGAQVRIVMVNAGRGAVGNLSRMGLSVGNIVKVARNSSFRGPVLVVYRDTEIAIGHKLASKITVEQA